METLIEKKDLLNYIGLRLEELRKIRRRAIEKALPRKRGLIQERFRGKILELEQLKAIIHSGGLKRVGKAKYRRLCKGTEKTSKHTEEE